MARNRYLPFGYRIRQGEITIYPIEAAYIREIFSAYIDGSSYAQIAQDMQDRGIQYHEGTTAWNKHMVKRILENERYTGKDGYPAIVSSEQYKRAAAVRQSKGGAQPARKPRTEALPTLSVEIKAGMTDITTVRLENQIRQELTKPVMEPERLRSMICQCAVKKYDACFHANKPISGKKMDAASVHFDV